MRVRAVLFDVFGTCVDWYSSVARELARHASDLAVAADIPGMTLAWRQAYFDGMAEVRTGRAAWQKIDAIHRQALDKLLPQYGLAALDENARQRLNRVWHHLFPWPDTQQGLSAIKQDHYIATLSNGNLDLLMDLARFGDLPWDTLFCSDLFHHFKPDPKTYLGACALLDCEPNQIMMVASHRSDLDAAAKLGLQTAFVERPAEFGFQRAADKALVGEYDLVVADFVTLSEQLLEPLEADV